MASTNNSRLYLRLLLLAWKYRGACLRILLIQFVLLSMGLFGLGLTGVGIDYIRFQLTGSEYPVLPLGISPPREWSALQALGSIAGVILLLALARAVLNYVYAVSINRLLQQQLVPEMRGIIYEKLHRLSFRFFDDNSTGSIITRVTSDVQMVRAFLEQVLFQGLIMAISLTVYVWYMVALSPALTLACLATAPLIVAASAQFSRKIQPDYAHNRTLVERMVQTLAESLQGIAVTKSFGREADDLARFDAANDACRTQQQGIFWRISLFSPAMGFLTRINMMVLLGYGGWLVAQGRLPLGTGLIVFAGLLEQFSGQINQLAAIVNSTQQSLIGARRVFDLLDAPIEVKSAPDALRCGRLRGHVRFEHVAFAYDGISPILRDIDLDVKPGQRVAILGATGAGKSVLMSLIPRFYDVTGGRLLIDGHDVRTLGLDELRRNIGLVFQESFLFSNTVASNIAFGHPEATREQIEQAARTAAAHEFIVGLPQGYDTVLGESGNSLSGGQRQRLAIARAILLEPSILLLDDPTAAVDSETEHLVLEAIERAMTGRTTFIVAHRVSTLRRADLIIVMEGGRIVQRGTHEELLRQPGPYRQVAELQLADARDLALPANEEEPRR